MSNRSTAGLLLLAVALVGSMACGGATVSASRMASKASVAKDEQGAAKPGPAPKEGASETGLSNTLKWQTASEVENFGFDVYRSDREEGPFVRLTESPIPGSGTSDVPTKYEFADTSIEPDTAYYYYVESISTAGVRQRFTPIFRSKPKSLAKPAEPNDEN